MANPKEALQARLGGFKPAPVEVRPVDPGALEPDDFIINNVALRIPPTQIHVEKQAFNHEWQTLRTTSSQKVKSGHSIARVSIDVIFKGPEDVNERLRHLVAGLRATPFCVVHNLHLDRTLGRPDDETTAVSNKNQYKNFKPIMLAMTSMSFSTAGHQNMPDCVVGRFDFLWFNYLPFTPLIAYKSGNDFSKPGYPWHSLLWTAFYDPFYKGTKPVQWHKDEVIGVGTKLTTGFKYNEFLMVPRGTAAAIDVAADLVKTIQNKPEEALGKFHEVLRNGDPEDITSQGVFDLLYRKLVKSGAALPSEELRNKLQSLPPQSITDSVSDLLSPALAKISKRVQKGGLQTARKEIESYRQELDNAVRTLVDRSKKRQGLERQGRIGDKFADEHQFKKVLKDIDAKFGTAGAQSSAGGLSLFGRKRTYLLEHTEGTIVEQVVISFNNILSVIPMAGYRYPTCQHVGSIDAEVTFIINCDNAVAGDINKIYDTVEAMALRFKQIPQGFHTLHAYNDFLGLFNIEEFLTKSITTDTVPGQPGRSRVVLSLIQSGVTSKTRFNDPETLNQEFLTGDEAIYKEIWKTLRNYLQEEGQKNTRNPEDSYERYKLERYNIKNILSNFTLIQLIDQARDNYNRFLKNLHSEVFPDTTEGRVLSGHFLNLTDRTQQFGFIPGLHKLQTTLTKRNQVRSFRRMDNALGSSKSSEVLRREIAANKIVDKYWERKGTLSPQGRRTLIAAALDPPPEETLRDKERLLKEIGLTTYQTEQKNLFQIIIADHLDLPEFTKVRQLVESRGLGKGIMAYPDFRRQMNSLIGFVEGDTSIEEGQLLKYEPDAYFWYPAYDGSNASAENLIDAQLLVDAKRHSSRIFEDAQQKVSGFYRGLYLKSLKDSIWKGPYNYLAKNDRLKGLAPELYKDHKIPSSASFRADDKIAKTVTADPNIKLPTNFYSENGEFRLGISITASNDLVHEVSFQSNWEGVSAGPGQATGGGDSIPSGRTPHGDKRISRSDASGSKNRSRVLGLAPIHTRWPRPDSEQEPAVKNGVKFFCPIKNYNRIGGGSNPLEVRDIGKKSTSFNYRRKSVKRDWKTSRSILGEAKYNFDPDRAAKEMKPPKPVSKWTYSEYVKWKARKGGRRLGYVHKGADIYADVGTDVYACADGVVKYAGSGSGTTSAGLFIEINHDNPYIGHSRYLHLQEIDPKLRFGTRVKAGQCIAVSGRSGQRAMKPHLHFETWNRPVRRGQTRYSPGMQVLNPKATPIHWSSQSIRNAQRFKPDKPASDRINKISSRIIPRDVTTTVSSPIRLAIDEFTKDLLRGQAQSMMRAYPTFKLYFIEDDSGERKRLSFDDFFSYNAVKSIRVIRSRKIPADLCEIYLTNVSGTLSNRKFTQNRDMGVDPRDKKGNKVKETTNAAAAGTVNENPIASLLLQEGMNIQLRLGYTSDPSRLETVFNGKIMEVQFSDSDDLVKILAQSYAIELVQDIKGLEKPGTKKSTGFFGWNYWGFFQNAATSRILEEMIAEPEVLHFGRWEPGKGGATPNRELLTNTWRFQPQPADDNIFAPTSAEDISQLGQGLIVQKLQYTIYRTTIWDIFQEMTLRHPNFITLPVPYNDKNGPRMTMFFGLPNQLYFARHPTLDEQSKQKKIVRAFEEVENKLVDKSIKAAIKNPSGVFGHAGSVAASWVQRLTRFGSRTMLRSFGVKSDAVGNAIGDMVFREGFKRTVGGKMVSKVIGNVSREVRLTEAKKAGFVKPFRNYHLLTSAQHIIANNIRANARDVANTITIKYPAEVTIPVSTLGTTKTIKLDETEFTLKLDNALPTEEIRTQVITSFTNVTHEELAKRYALGMLMRNLKEIYKGEIIIIGNPKVKPLDVCMIFDEYAEMTGPIEVEQVTHVFDQENGFRTEIKPDMLVQAQEWTLLSSSEALGVVIEGVVRNMFGFGIGPQHSPGGLRTFAPWAYMMGAGVSMFGGFLANKIINYTQLAQPVVMAPLLHHGRIFAGGVPTRKIPTSIWTTIFGDWSAEADAGYYDWYEDVKDDILNSLSAKFGLHSLGEFGNFG